MKAVTRRGPVPLLEPGLATKCRTRAVSRVLFPAQVSPREAAIIHLGRPLPAASSDLTRWSRTGNPTIRRAGISRPFRKASLFGLAPGGV